MRLRLFSEDLDRERMLDMERRLRGPRRVAFGILAVAVLAAVPWVGWWTPVPLAVAFVLFSLPSANLERLRRPELAVSAAWVASQVIIAGSVALIGLDGMGASVLAWFAMPVVTLGARFSGLIVGAGVALTILLMVATAFATDAAVVIDDPPILIAPAAMVLAMAILSTALMNSDLEHRTEALIDPLTGMLNRHALEARKEELVQQAQFTREPIAVLVGDLDRFKRVNDSFGHPTGDTVLREIADILRKELRAFDLAYRIGGEEFLVLVPGAGVDEGCELADRLRRAVARAPISGQAITISFGVSASEGETPFDFDAVFAAADAALYEAKESGRDRVCVARRPQGEAVGAVPAADGP